MDGKKLMRGESSPRLRIEVTQAIIDKSIPKDSSHCMIAESIAAAHPRASHISVDLATIRFTDLAAGKRYVYLTPRHAQVALLQFDSGETPTAFVFRLQDAHVLRTGAARGGRATVGKNPKGGDNMPIRSGGSAPPLGPLHGTATRSPSKKVALPAGPLDGTGIRGGGARTGRRRAFGLRAIIR